MGSVQVEVGQFGAHYRGFWDIKSSEEVLTELSKLKRHRYLNAKTNKLEEG